MGVLSFTYRNGRYESEPVMCTTNKAMVRVEFSGECSAVVVESSNAEDSDEYVAKKRLMNGSALAVVEDSCFVRQRYKF